MPDDTIASAVSRISCSSMRQPNLFQLFQPIGGVGARPRGAAVVAVDAALCHAVVVANTVRRSPQPGVARTRPSFAEVSPARQAR